MDAFEGGCYVYGVVPSTAALPDGLRGVGDSPGTVRLVRHGGLAAAVSDVSQDRPLGSRHDLLAHQRVLDTLMTASTVLPMRFGVVLGDAEAVTSDLLEPHHYRFVDALAEFSGYTQFTVRGRYEQDMVLREVLAEDPETQRLQEVVRELLPDSGYYDRIRLGELVFHALQRTREADGEVAVDTLAPYAASIRLREPAGDDGAVDAAVLVGHEHRDGFERAVEHLGARWAGRIRLRMLGPLPPYDFVELEED
ncbi:MAG: gas vesicle protein GvpFL [Streptosporangiales bacterium]|nr:gas vesicle protein GvpFL [Streptosporangiales bacterium]